MKKRGKPRRWFMRLPRRKRATARKRGRWKVEKVEKLEKAEKGDKRVEEKKRLKVSRHTAQERCRAVLAVWTERQKPGEVSREMGLTVGVLSQWQERAMEGMLDALEPRAKQEEGGIALSPRLAVLLERKSKFRSMRLERRLTRLQESLSGTGEATEIAGEKKP